MNRYQKRYARIPRRNESDERITVKQRKPMDVEEVLPPRSRRDAKDKPTHNRCCFIAPDNKSFGQLTEPDMDRHDWYQNLLYDHDLDPFNPDTTVTSEQLRDLKKMLYNTGPRVDIGSQYSRPIDTYRGKSAHWQTVNNTDEINRQISKGRDEETITKYHNLPKHIHISETPRIKIIAQKYQKYKQNDIELRKLDEKVVCVEYDVYDKSETELAKPVQVMRAFFAFKPVGENCENTLTDLPSTIKTKFNISSQDLQKLNEQEVEIIDSQIKDNQPYLKDLRKILQRKVPDKKNVNLQNLYEMANRELLDINIEQNLTKDELNDIQKLILVKSKSSVHGISRRAVKEFQRNSKDCPIISQMILNELLRED